MLLRSVPRHKLLVVLLLLFTSAFLVRETIFSKSIQQLVEEAAEKEGKEDSTNRTTATASTTTTAKPWILPSSQVRLWMDIPNAFPWRHCIEEYNNIVTLLSCYKVSRY